MEDTSIQIYGHNAHNGKQEFATHNGKQEAFIPHAREQVTMIMCSPNMKNIVTWSDVDKSAVCWCISDNQQELELKHKISLENNKKYKNHDKYFIYSKYIKSNHSKNFGDIKNYFTVSDDKFVSMPISEEKDEVKVVIKDYDEYIKRIKVGIFKFETGKNVSLKLPHSEMIVETLAFLNENKLIMISKEPLYRVYIFTRKDDEFIHQSTIKVETYDEKIFLSNGKLFIYDVNLGSITKWDINTLKFEACFLFDNSFDVDNMKLSDNGVLLFVYGRKREDNWHKNPYSCISIYSADHGNKFTTYKYDDKTVIDAVYLIASDIGARLLIVHHKTFMKKNEEEKKYQYHICDPFAPCISNENYVKANKLFEDLDVNFDNNFENKFENKYIIKNDKIVGFNHGGKLVIERLIPDNDNWISYLRNELKDFNRIFISSVSEKIIDLIVKSKKMIEKSTTDVYKEYPKKYFVTWTLKYEKMNIFLKAEFKNDKIEQTDRIQIVPELYLNSDMEVEKFVDICDCLDNDDLAMVAYWGIVVWTFNTKNYKIELNYCWENENETWDWKVNEIIELFYETGKENFDVKNFDIKKLKKKSYFLPPSSYINMIRYNPAFSQPHLQPPEDLEDIINEDEETLLRKLLNGCIKQIEEDGEIPNPLIFNIFSQSITKIFKKNPSFFDDFVTKISLLCILKIISKFKPFKTHPQIFLMFPFPNFVTYYETEKKDSFLKKLFKPRSSHFGNINDSTFYNTWNGEALINFKWNTFGKKYYFAIWIIYLVFFGSFIIVATLSKFISWPCQMILLIITAVLGFWHLFFEIHNFTFSHKEYFESLWNYLDLSAIISAIVTSIIWLINGSVSTGAITFTTLLLELKFIIYLRFIRCFGIYLAMIMNTADKVVAFLILFGLIILAFAHSLHLLLRSEIFQDSGVNMFMQFGSAILAAYYMMVTGDSTPVSEWVSNEDIIIMTLMMLFSFFILTYLMNLFIGILGNLLGDNKDNHLAYLKLKKRGIIFFVV
ncbi:transient receptor potential cation channel subfamily a member 1-like [Gigaspora margarita]|uniref:Transient receptor potential cation channel subfamily a member 1-like n=1 Tax=Gigaspora margarita TaxID=4874 RepID=A0A8H3X873_GIGMA|nr:transient receptor potential cation channel subfamily a member 1-like [Gigaspora margarita]